MTDEKPSAKTPAEKPQNSMTYADAGVDIDAGNELIKRIAPMAKATARPGADSALGGFGGLFDLAACGYDDPVLVAANDGVGTKLKIAIEAGQHRTVGIDLVAMCVNDLIVQGAEPLFFLDYFASGKLQLDIATDVIAGIADGCKLAGCALIGGETAEMPGLYQSGDYDLAGFSLGAVERNAILPRKDIAAGDILLGLASDGVHSNGFSLVRRIVAHSGLNWQDSAPYDTITLAESLLTPTRIYVKPVLHVLQNNTGLKALCHITGGGFPENLPRILPDTLSAEVDLTSWSLPPVFGWLQETGNIATAELLRTFNCGIGMVLVVKADEAENIAGLLTAQGETVIKIGRITPRDNQAVELKGSFDPPAGA